MKVIVDIIFYSYRCFTTECLNKYFCILHLFCSANGLSLLAFTCFCMLSSVSFVLAFSAWRLVLAFSGFDMVSILGFGFGVFCVTLTLLDLQNLLALNKLLTLPGVAYFFD